MGIKGHYLYAHIIKNDEIGENNSKNIKGNK
jgi:hypothetical protein